MSDSLRDQLLGLGFKPAPKPDKLKPAKPPPDARRAHERAAPRQRRAPAASPRSRGDIDLAKAYAIRAQREKDERIEAERRRQEDARQRREARAKLAVFLEGKALNVPEADIARHFDYGGKIKRVHVTEPQLKALNAGALGVVQLNGRYLLVEASVLAEVEFIFAAAVALKSLPRTRSGADPEAPAGDDPYADPQYRVPDDLVW